MDDAIPPSPLVLTVAPEWAGKRLDLVLDALVPDLSRARLQKLVRRGKVRIDGERVRRSNLRVQGGQTVVVDAEAGTRPEVGAIEALYLDEDLIGIHKPAGLVMHPTERLDEEAVCDLVARRYGRLSTLPGDHRPGVVHRLDRWTSGVVVLARTDLAARSLRRQFSERAVKKTYLAIAHGVPEWEHTILEDHIGPHPHHTDLQIVDPPEKGRDARTDVTVLERFAEASLLECHPHTGRRHQIRLQLSEAGHPLAGDDLYRPPAGMPVHPATFTMRRHALHALELRFRHPRREIELCLRAGMPRDMEALVEALRAG